MKRIVALALSALALAACGSGDDVSVENAWSRASAPGQTSGAIYFDLTVPEDDTLVGASVPDSVATHAGIHEVVMVDPEMSGDMDDDMEMSGGSDDMDTSSMDMGGEMRMQELPDGLALTGGATVAFEPGSYHVMLPELAEPLEVGDEFELTLDFAAADDVSVTIVVAESAP